MEGTAVVLEFIYVSVPVTWEVKKVCEIGEEMATSMVSRGYGYPDSLVHDVHSNGWTADEDAIDVWSLYVSEISLEALAGQNCSSVQCRYTM